MAVYAEDVNYFNTSTTHFETWIERAKKEITAIGGEVLQSGYAEKGIAGTFMLECIIGGDKYAIRWETLPARKPKTSVASLKRQAATLLYHDVKYKCVMAKIRGVRATFLEYLSLPGGQTMGEAVANIDQLKAMLANTPIMLGPGD